MGKVRGRKGTESKATGTRTSAVSESQERLIQKYLNAKGKEKELLLKIIKRIKPDFKE
jgi:hypothetical protein